VFCLLIVATVAWGALAFGAVYPWAYWPLLGASVGLGCVGLLASDDVATRRLNVPIALSVAAVFLAAALTLVPLDRAVLAAVSPATERFLRQYNLTYRLAVATGGDLRHPLSINPGQTRLGVAFLGGFAILFLGLTRYLDGRKIRRILPGIVAVGVLLSLIGIIQRASYNGRIYGFWIPRAGLLPFTSDGGPFGPFINRNHFAGWMLMALPLSLAYLAALFQTGMRGVRPDRGSRLAWFSSREANLGLLVSSGVLIMGLALLLTLSRSGITCLAVALLLSAITTVRRRVRLRGAIYVAYLLAFVALTVSWAGIDAIAQRFERADDDLGGRLGAWSDALAVIRDFPVVGTGLNTYGTAMLLYQKHGVGLVHYAEAHNDYLQLLAEGGLLVTTPALIAVVLFALEVRRRFREAEDDLTGYWIRLGAVTAAMALGLQEAGEFSLQMPGNAALFVVICSFAVRRATVARTQTKRCATVLSASAGHCARRSPHSLR